MRPKAYLTIDLDYWNGKILPYDWLEKMLSLVPKNRSMVLDHHDVLKHLNFLGASHLVNVDWHSDLGGFVHGEWANKRKKFDPKELGNVDLDDFLPTLNCGTWVDWVRWNNTSLYTWIHPNEKCALLGGDGRCEGDDVDAFELGVSVWKRVDHFVGGRIPRIPDFNYLGVNLCLSEDYLVNKTSREKQTIAWFAEMGKKYKLLTNKELDFCKEAMARPERN